MMNTDAEVQAASIRVWAGRRCGELLKEMEKSKGGGDVKSKNHSTRRALSGYRQGADKAGTSKDQSSRWQRLAVFFCYLGLGVARATAAEGV